MIEYDYITRFFWRKAKNLKKRGWRESRRVLYYDSRADESGGRAKASPSTRAAQDVPWKLHNAKQLDFESNKPDATSLRRSNPSVNETTILLQEWHFEPTGSQIDYGLLWRVWSWLRTNAGGVLNTCKSNGMILKLAFRESSGKRVSNT